MEWVKEDTIKNCMRCNVPFTALRRKHHCRVCGKVFCDSCSSLRLPINGVMERVCKDCFAGEKKKRDQWELVTNRGFCSPCGKAIKYPDYGCMKTPEGMWSCKEKPYMILDLEKNIWSVKVEEMKAAEPEVIPKKIEPVKAKSRSSSFSSQTRQNRVTFRDVKSGNVSEDILRASTVLPSQEKVYEDERIEGCCQTDDLPVVNINPVSFISLSASAIAQLRQEVSTPDTTHVVFPPEEELLPPTELTASTRIGYEERSEITQLYGVVSDKGKEIKGKVQRARARQELREEQIKDEEEMHRRREYHVQSLIKKISDDVDATSLVQDNMVKEYQELCSEFRVLLTRESTSDEPLPEVTVHREQFEPLDKDSLIAIATTLTAHMKKKDMIEKKLESCVSRWEEIGRKSMGMMMQQQEAINTCINNCLQSFGGIQNELLQARAQNAELRMQVNKAEETTDQEIQQFGETIAQAEQLAFLCQQQLYSFERRYQQQETKLLEAQAAKIHLQRELREMKAKLQSLESQIALQEEELQLEKVTPQWRVLRQPEPPKMARTASVSSVSSISANAGLQRAASVELADDGNCDGNRIREVLQKWGLNKAPGQVNSVQEWLEMLLSGKQVEMEHGKNTIELCMFDLEQRELFVTSILPLIHRCKNLECFVQEHHRHESDFRITVVNREEAIPAISVPVPVSQSANDLEEKVETSFKLIPSKDEEEEEEEIRQSDLDAISRVVGVPEASPAMVSIPETMPSEMVASPSMPREPLSTIPEVLPIQNTPKTTTAHTPSTQKDRRRRVKMINLE